MSSSNAINIFVDVDDTLVRSIGTKLIQSGIKKLIQQGLVKEAKSKTSTEKQWIWAMKQLFEQHPEIRKRLSSFIKRGLIRRVKPRR